MKTNSLVFDEASQINKKLMELTLERQKVIANNMANVNTPNYIRQDLRFQEELKHAIEEGDLDSIENVKGEIIEDTNHPTRVDGNNVSIAGELNEMMQNSLMYNMLTRIFATRINILKTAIK